jgi:hypothetical protein
MDLRKIAAKLDEKEILSLKYKMGCDGEIRTDRLLDVAEDTGILYVSQNGVPVFVKLDEAIEIIEE